MSEKASGNETSGGSTGRLLVALMVKGGVYLGLGVLLWPVLAVVVTGGPPVGVGADRLSGVAAVLGASFSAAGALAFAISAPRVPSRGLRKAMRFGAVLSVVVLAVQLYAAVDVVSRNTPSAADDGSVGTASAPTGNSVAPSDERTPRER